MQALFDTNILVDYLNGVVQARDELARYEDRAISVVTWMEVLVGAGDDKEDHAIRAFLDDFTVVELSRVVAEAAIAIRRQSRLRLPDAIIRASARHLGALLVTRNTKDFSTNDPGIRVPYRI